MSCLFTAAVHVHMLEETGDQEYKGDSEEDQYEQQIVFSIWTGRRTAADMVRVRSDRLSGRVSNEHEKTDDHELTHDKGRRQDARTYKIRLDVQNEGHVTTDRCRLGYVKLKASSLRKCSMSLLCLARHTKHNVSGLCRTIVEHLHCASSLTQEKSYISSSLERL